MKQRTTMTDEDRKTNQPYDLDTIPAPEHQTKTAKNINKFFVLALVIIAICLGVILKWSIEGNEPLVIKNSPFPTRSVRANAEANGVIILTIDYCKNTEVQGEVRTSFVSETREIFAPLAKERYEPGCRKQEVPILIPKDLPADDYKLKFIARYDINPLKKQVPVTFESQTFHVNPLGSEPVGQRQEY